MTYQNIPTVAVLLIPTIDRGVVIILRRDNGKWALPGGYQEPGETWQQAAVREVKEEISLDLDAHKVRHFDTVTTPGGTNLIFGQYSGKLDAVDVLTAELNYEEVLGLEVVHSPIELAFPLHTAVLEKYFEKFIHVVD